MNRFYKKVGIIFVMAFAIMLGSFTNVLAADNNQVVKINNVALNFNKIIYVSDINGDDTNGDGSQSKPFKGLWKCLNYLCDNNLKTNVAIVMDDGDYDWTQISSGDSCNVNSKFNGMKVSFIAKHPGKVFVHSTNGLELLIIEGNPSWRIKFAFYNIVFHNITGDYNLTCLGGDDWTNEYYNCVFDKLSGIGGWNKKVSNASVKTVNCLFNQCSEMYYKSDPLSGESINSASTNDILDPYLGTKSTCLTNISTDASYNITGSKWKNTGNGINPDGSVANVGVYGGDFAWGTWNTSNVASSISLNKSADSLKVGQTDQLIATTSPTGIGVTWKSSDESIATVDQTGKVTAVKEGTATITATTTDGSNLSAKCIVTVIPKGTTPTNPTDNTGNAILTITMTNGQSREYDLSMDEINKFTEWYNNKDAGNGSPYYTFNKNPRAGAFTKRVENLVFDKISQFDIDEYDKK